MGWGRRVCWGLEVGYYGKGEEREKKNNLGRGNKEVRKSMVDVGNYSYFNFVGFWVVEDKIGKVSIV